MVGFLQIWGITAKKHDQPFWFNELRVAGRPTGGNKPGVPALWEAAAHKQFALMDPWEPATLTPTIHTDYDNGSESHTHTERQTEPN